MLHRRLLVVLALACAVPAMPLTALTGLPPSERLRPQSAFVAALLDEALARSPTTRALVERVRAGDVIVYVETGRQLDSSLSACVTWMNAGPDARFLRVTLRLGMRRPDAVAMLAHELQHVVEVIDHPEVRSREGLIALYRAIGHRTSYDNAHWDTVAAVRAGIVAKSEVMASA